MKIAGFSWYKPIIFTDMKTHFTTDEIKAVLMDQREAQTTCNGCENSTPDTTPFIFCKRNKIHFSCTSFCTYYTPKNA